MNILILVWRIQFRKNFVRDLTVKFSDVRNALFDFFKQGPVSISYYKIIIITTKKIWDFLHYVKTYLETKFQLLIRKTENQFGRPINKALAYACRYIPSLIMYR